MHNSFNQYSSIPPSEWEKQLEFHKKSLQDSILTSAMEAVRILGRAGAADWLDLDILPLVEKIRKLLTDESLGDADCCQQLEAFIPLLGLEEFQPPYHYYS